MTSQADKAKHVEWTNRQRVEELIQWPDSVPLEPELWLALVYAVLDVADAIREASSKAEAVTP
jgi:hypothetical protein